MAGKLLVIALLLSTAIAGGALYYLQIYGFYYTVDAQPGQDVQLMEQDTNAPQPIAYTGFTAIDADSSPIRYRACFTTDLSLEDLSAAYVESDKTEPRVAPDWFDCFDAQTIGTAISEGRARTYLAAKNIHFGVDRIVAVMDDGKGYVWHEFNDCGEKAYDGTVVGETCPERPTN
ncbi:hypothetical protein TRL7639_03214 [Falsiruegeria litorea R37]|uniref:Histidine kinase n=1 Tax=Falsiruegeria litorea R37 TaxID=1200284 RepID=A0A1Y5T8K7_9RHOB|nr:DUF6446 family protein [Falsiruegeria litorea]SLN58415.1 hypothetical protein TRL7639_03214 [Falsiruegeria litorea R37]